VERASEIPSFTTLSSQYTNTCTKWNAFANSAQNLYPKTDSGLRRRRN